MKGKLLFFTILFSVVAEVAMAQRNDIDIAVKNEVTGNGLAPRWSSQIGYKLNSNEISLGLCFQKIHMNLSGVECTYRRILHQSEGTTILFFAQLTYSKGYLGKNLAKLEGSVKPEFVTYFEEVKLNVLDEHLGIGVKFLETNISSCFASIGAGSYQTIGKYDKCLYRFRDRVATSLLINFGINFKFYKTAKESELDDGSSGKL